MNKSQTGGGYRERVTRLSEKLQGIQINLESERSSRFSDLEKQLDDLAKEFTEAQDINLQKFSMLKDSIQKIEKNLNEEMQNRDSFFESKSHEMLAYQNKIQETFVRNSKSLKENERNVFKFIEDKVQNFKLRMVEENKLVRASQAESVKSIEQDIPKLFEFVENCVTDREEMERLITGKVEAGLSELENEMAVETKTREETEEAMLAMLRDVVSRIKSDLELEKKEREASEETLLSLLEETCSKLSTVNY